MRLLTQTVWVPFNLARVDAGRSNPAKMAMTTGSPINVKALEEGASFFDDRKFYIRTLDCLMLHDLKAGAAANPVAAPLPLYRSFNN